MTISLFEKKADYVECKLCPHRCQLRSGDAGKCSVRKCDGNTISLSNYGELVSIAVNPIHKKPFQKYLPGTKVLSVSGWGCNLQCLFCENHKISQVKKYNNSKIFTPESIVEMAHTKNCESVCMTFNEPTISFEYLIDLAEACHNRGLKFLLKTNAYVNEEPWREICAVTDAMGVDFKGCDIQYREMTGAKEFVIEDRIRESYNSGVHLEISIPLYPSFLEDMRAFFKCSQFLGSLDKNIPCHLLKINPAYKISGTHPIDKTSIDLARDILSFYMSDVHVVI